MLKLAKIRAPKFISLLVLIAFGVSLTFGLSGCSSDRVSASGGSDVEMASMDLMPENVRSAPTVVQKAYQFAVANPEVLTQIPCYCGCGAVGHASNYACFVQSDDGSGQIVFDGHALGCTICVDIALDTMRMLQDGRQTDDIRAAIDQTYGQFGPSNINP